jgi:hypothetical protein
MDRDALLLELAKCYARAAAAELFQQELARRAEPPAKDQPPKPREAAAVNE